VDGFAFREESIPLSKRPEIDQWILSSLNSLINQVEKSLDAYEPTQAGRAIEDFVDAHLSNWYVRLSRRRFWKGEYEHDKISAYQTLYECLETLSLLIAPIAPFYADWMFNNLNGSTGRFKENSVHHCYFPKSNHLFIDEALELRMKLAQEASSLILSLRKKINIKVRQPLQKVFIPALNTRMASDIKLVEEIIKAETNIKEIDILNSDNDFIKKKAKANFKSLGRKLGEKMKYAAAKIADFDNETIEKVLSGSYILNEKEVAAGAEPINIVAEDLEIITDEIPGFEVAVKGNLTVALDVTITESLKNEGNAREFINRIQGLRKENNYELTDRIAVTIGSHDIMERSLIQYKDYICREILADSLDFSSYAQSGVPIAVNEATLTVNVIKTSK
jgi:isoleucyl-tRNA synthetase